MSNAPQTQTGYHRRRRALVHIGMPKAGSTTIQKFLWINRDELARRGFVYERFDQWRINHPEYVVTALMLAGEPVDHPMFLGWFGTGDPARCQRYRDDCIAALDAAPDGCTWIISSEHFYGLLLSPKTIGALHKLLAERFDEVRYLIYLRRQDAFCESLYGQDVRSGSAESLRDFLSRWSGPDYDAQMRTWQDAVGSDNLTIRVFERASFVGGDLILDFCDIAGLDPEGLETIVAANEALSARQVTLLRGLNTVVGKSYRYSRLASRARRWLTQATSRILAGDRVRLSERDRLQLLDSVAASNERLRARALPHKPALFLEESAVRRSLAPRRTVTGLSAEAPTPNDPRAL